MMLCWLAILLLNTVLADLRIKEPNSDQKPILSQAFDDGSRASNHTLPHDTENLKLPPIPKPDNGPLNVYIGFYIESLGGFETSKMTYDMDIFFLTSWRDPTLVHNEKTIKVINDKHSLPYIWKPDLYFANARQGVFQHATVPNFVMYLYPNGTVAFSIRVTLNVACNLELHYYPMDTQTCGLKIMSYAYTWDEMVVRWFSDKPLGRNRNISLPQFNIMDLQPVYCDGNHKYAMTETQGYKRADFSCLRAEIFLRRSVSHHLVQTYIPTGLIVCISWVSFWIDRMATAARVSLAFSTILTLATMVAGISFNVPPVSYVKALDVWFAFCVIFVFLALVEFAIVNSLMRSAVRYHELSCGGSTRRKRSVERHVEHARVVVFRKRSSVNVKVKKEQTTARDLFVRKADLYSYRAMRVDHVSRILFPTTFFIFSILYWLIYMVFV